MSDARLRTVIAGLAVLGLAIAAYLTYVHYAHVKVVCLANGGCETVQQSAYAKLAGVPVALLGLLAYASLLLSLLLRGEGGRAAGALVALVGFGFSAYLTYRELFTIKAICQWCVGSAVVMTLLAVATTVRFLRAPAAAPASGPGDYPAARAS